MIKMEIFPAIDLYGKKAVRLFKGNYDEMTVYSDFPEETAKDFMRCGAKNIHIVDLEGAKDGNTPNIDVIEKIIKSTDMFAQVGGGIRSLETIEKYVSIGVGRVILGTAAVKDEELLKEAIRLYGEKTAVGVDIKDGYVAIKGWREKSQYTFMDFCKKMQDMGVKTLICTDISKDGAMQGTNHELYSRLSKTLDINIIASGGVSSTEDIKKLAALSIYGAIIGKAYYTGAINLREAIEVAR